MRILITGAAGQLGKDLIAHAEQLGDDVHAFDRSALDIRDSDAVAAAVTQIKPDVLANCAAWTAVDACESDPELANEINGDAVGVLADAARSIGAHLVQVSTDYVFDGTKPGSYGEDDKPNPQSAYGRSKLLGESLAGDDASVVRTSWVYSKHGGNMVATICRLAAEHEVLRFVDDQVGHPTYTAHLAIAIRNLAMERASGIWHCTNAGQVSWFDFAQAVLAAGGHDPERVLPVATADMQPPRPAPRPANSALKNSRYNSEFTPLVDFRETLVDVVGAYL